MKFPDPPERLPGEAPEGFAVPEKQQRSRYDHETPIDVLFAEFERGRTIGLREAGAEYRRGFTDALMLASGFALLGAIIGVALAAVLS